MINAKKMTEYRYTAKQVKEFLNIYKNMVRFYEKFKEDTSIPKYYKIMMENTLYIANTKFPNELKVRKFNFYLDGLEKILRRYKEGSR